MRNHSAAFVKRDELGVLLRLIFIGEAAVVGGSVRFHRGADQKPVRQRVVHPRLDQEPARVEPHTVPDLRGPVQGVVQNHVWALAWALLVPGDHAHREVGLQWAFQGGTLPSGHRHVCARCARCQRTPCRGD